MEIITRVVITNENSTVTEREGEGGGQTELLKNDKKRIVAFTLNNKTYAMNIIRHKNGKKLRNGAITDLKQQAGGRGGRWGGSRL